MNELTLTIPTQQANVNPEPAITYPPRNLLTPLPTPGHFLLVIDNSSLERFTTCPMSAYYGLVLKREAHARNAALTFGGAIHEGLESYLLGESDEQQNARVIKFFTENPAPLDEYRTLNNALSVLDAYRQRAALSDYSWEIQSDADGPIIERAFELPLGVIEVEDWIEMPWLTDAQYYELQPRQGERKVWVKEIHVAWSGRIDAVAKCNGAVRVVDHKTTSIAGDSFTQDFQNSSQTQGYTWAARQLWPELDIHSFCLNAIHFRKPTGSGPITQAGPRGGAAALNFFRGYYDYSDKVIAKWEQNTINIVSDFIHSMVRNFYTQHGKWCNGKYGRCQYYDVCWSTDDDAVRQRLIYSDMFKPVTWNPVAGR